MYNLSCYNGLGVPQSPETAISIQALPHDVCKREARAAPRQPEELPHNFGIHL